MFQKAYFLYWAKVFRTGTDRTWTTVAVRERRRKQMLSRGPLANDGWLTNFRYKSSGTAILKKYKIKLEQWGKRGPRERERGREVARNNRPCVCSKIIQWHAVCCALCFLLGKLGLLNITVPKTSAKESKGERKEERKKKKKNALTKMKKKSQKWRKEEKENRQRLFKGVRNTVLKPRNFQTNAQN